MPEKYVIVSEKGEIIKSYTHFKQAIKDMDFFKLMYKELYLYQMIVSNNEQ